MRIRGRCSAAVLAGMVACSFVLDAFEMIFLVVPLVMPPLLTVVPDPAWVATLTLLVLQMGFLLPPLGYAVVMSRLATPGTAAAWPRWHERWRRNWSRRRC